jgi:perosamine synthetase
MIPVNTPLLGERERAYVLQCLDTGWISSAGSFVNAFESSFAAFCGTSQGVSTTSGTAALHLALAALKIGPGDEVILPTLTIAACAFAVRYVGATPILVDVEPETGNMNPALVERKVTPRTRAIMPVHLYGHPADLDPLLEIAQRHHLAIIEDAAEAHGSLYRGRAVGGIGTVGCFSFYANKLITTGEGGMIVTNDEQLAQRARWLKDLAHSPEQRFAHEEVGFNYRMTNVQAAIGLAQLERVEESIARKQWMAARYKELLAGTPGLLLPSEAPWARNTYWMFAVRLSQAAKLSRNAVMAALRARGVDSRAFFVPMHRQPVFLREGRYAGERYPVAEELAETGFYLPSGLAITEEQIREVCATVHAVMD